MIIKSIRIEKLAYQGECRRLLLGGSILIEHSTKCQGRLAHLRRKGVIALPRIIEQAIQFMEKAERRREIMMRSINSRHGVSIH